MEPESCARIAPRTRDQNLLREADKVRTVLVVFATLYVLASPSAWVPLPALAWGALALAALTTVASRALADRRGLPGRRSLQMVAGLVLVGDMAWLMALIAGTGGFASPFWGLLLVAILFAGIVFGSLPLALPLVTVSVAAWATGTAVVYGLDVAITWTLAGRIIAAVAVGWLGWALSSVLERERLTNAHLISHLREGVAVLDADQRLLTLNPRAERLLGLRAEQAVGRRLRALTPALAPVLGRALEEGLRQAAQHGPQTRRVELPGDPPQALRLVLSSHRLPGVPLLGWMVAVEDVTDLEAAARRQEEGLAIVSHELRAPLSAVRGLAQVLNSLGGEMDEQQRSSTVAAIAGESRRLAEVVRRVLDATGDEQSPYRVEPQWVRAEELLAEVAESLRVRAEGRPLQIVWRAAPDLPPLWADPTRLGLVLRSLGENALRYTPDGGCITLSAAAQGEQTLLTVGDTGPGVPPAERELIFQKWTRGAEQPGGRASGLGLGLYVARRVAEAHGGSLTLDSAPGGGAAFTVALPLPEADQQRAAA